MLLCIVATIMCAHSAGLSWFELINGAETFLIDEMPTLPGPWFGPSKSATYDNHTCQSIEAYGPCPRDFPYPDQKNHGVSCYNQQSYAASGEGPCGSWCTKDISVGAGCGDNHKYALLASMTGVHVYTAACTHGCVAN